ncbi:hypothetical protein [Streptosporangium carneum]|uniref:Uncharacterized protein n=1 Tax=Streptosporangium carneum TaxID=47481 RepID=A0A9W6MCE8_9ACTN|nr:hypothetical protein [Streptosporangium carneum]GLK09086.1 hypothetical protein GCM10017600_24920 [Streptosporangium carneum]
MRSQAKDASAVQCSTRGRKNRLPRAASGIPQRGDRHQPLPWVTKVGDSERFTVQAISTLVVIDQGRVVTRRSGAAPVPALGEWGDDALAA